jgi:hypothetical protein
MNEIDPVQYGAIIAKVEMMEKKIDGMDADIKSLLELANKSRGGFWVGMAITSSISGFVGYLTHIFLSK